MRLFGRRGLLGMCLALATGGIIYAAGSRAELLQRLDRAYAEWSLRFRIASLSKARIKGDLERTSRFVIHSCEPRASLGSAVRYLSFTAKEIKIRDNVAEAQLSMTYKVALPGLYSESAPPEQMDIRQRWVRAGRTWYWDPGPLTFPGMPMGAEPAGGKDVSETVPSTLSVQREQGGG